MCTVAVVGLVASLLAGVGHAQTYNYADREAAELVQCAEW